jgi:hypothetical protein
MITFLNKVVDEGNQMLDKSAMLSSVSKLCPTPALNRGHKTPLSILESGFSFSQTASPARAAGRYFAPIGLAPELAGPLAQAFNFYGSEIRA